MTAPQRLPFPPLDLANRVGSLASAPDPYQFYDDLGKATRDGLASMLPGGWDWAGKRVLDFGCGAGRTLRHWTAEAGVSEFSGCDIDAESIAWLDAHLNPPFSVFVNGAEPPLPVADRSFDLVYAVSVFTHLTRSWSRWMVELQRVLADDGIALLTFMGPGIAEFISGEPWDEPTTGMLVFREGQSWDLGGPMVLHSEWWIREHWGRAFDVLDVRQDGFGAVPGGPTQGIVALHRRPGPATAEDLERLNTDDPREAMSLARNLRFVQDEVVALRAGAADAEARAATAEHEVARLTSAYDAVVRSRSWRMTEPLRGFAARLRARRAG